jgi:hypothetical protein
MLRTTASKAKQVQEQHQQRRIFDSPLPLPAEANRELDDARRDYSRGAAKSIEIFRRVKRGSLEVGQRQNLSIGPEVEAGERVEAAGRAVEIRIWRAVYYWLRH